jgi:hypothetical protein
MGSRRNISSLLNDEQKAYDGDPVTIIDQEEIIDSYSSNNKSDYTFFEGECFLKTKSDRFKRHWCVIMGNEIYCYRQ